MGFFCPLGFQRARRYVKPGLGRSRGVGRRVVDSPPSSFKCGPDYYGAQEDMCCTQGYHLQAVMLNSPGLGQREGGALV